jgi:PTK7 protein tyrosine kinase 7
MSFLAGQSQPVVHRDLALRNVMVFKAKEFSVKVGDFGLARGLEDGRYRNTPGEEYPFTISPPESLETLEWTLAADVWSYGLLLWSLFNEAAEPFAEYVPDRLHALLPALKAGTALQQGICPTPIWNMVTRCMRIRPSARPNFASMMTDLQQITST